jgi:prolyl-tRNA synthetase
MKDLYTFDLTPSLALSTYEQVRKIYARLFDELKLPYLVAEADSGDMGGNLSHEFHFPTSKGEDHVISCSNCNYVANEELAESPIPRPHSEINSNGSGTTDDDCNGSGVNILVWRGISRDRRTLVNVWYPSSTTFNRVTPMAGSIIPEVNVHAVRAVVGDLDASVEDPLPFWENINSTAAEDGKLSEVIQVPIRLLNLVDCRLPKDAWASIRTNQSHLPLWPTSIESCPQDMEVDVVCEDPFSQKPLNLLRIVEGDPCPRCSDGKLKVQKAIELGHTFHLSTRYSEPLEATVMVPTEELNELKIEASGSIRHVPMQMGCHGIGVSRMIGAVADTLADEKGLNWPRVMAPFEVVIVPSKGLDEAALEVYDVLCTVPTTSSTPQLDLILDDRAESFPWKMQDADLVGYPVIVVVGRRWKAESICEVQCRRLQLRQEIPIGELAGFIESVLSRL